MMLQIKGFCFKAYMHSPHSSRSKREKERESERKRTHINPFNPVLKLQRLVKSVDVDSVCGVLLCVRRLEWKKYKNNNNEFYCIFYIKCNKKVPLGILSQE